MHAYIRLMLAVALTIGCATGWSQTGAPPRSDAASPAKPASGAAVSPAPASTSPRPEDLEPGVNTSATPPPAVDSARPAALPGSPQMSPGPAAPGSGSTSGPTATAGPVPRAKTPDVSHSRAKIASSPSGEAGGAATKTAGALPAPGAAGGKAHDRIELDTTQITGNRELPKVLYIVPWKRSDLGDVVGKPVNSLLDEVLTPVDRDVFKRENRYYDALKPDGGKPADGAATPSGDRP